MVKKGWFIRKENEGQVFAHFFIVGPDLRHHLPQW